MSDAPGHSISVGAPVVGQGDVRGEVEQVVADRAIVRLRDGTRVLISAAALEPDADGVYRVDLATEHIDRARGAAGGAGGAQELEHLVVPEIEERVHVGKRSVETGRVRLRKVVREEEQEVGQELFRQEVRLERVERNEVVADADKPPQVRREGETLVIPLLEEVLVVEKRLMLREELRVTRAEQRRVEAQTVTLRRENVEVERPPPERG